ncbi:hypothetical protein SVIO_032380 [Streptomyces violaceusniger]|uniref:Uncharacterized protein n=1 Tax=Streptomyces violaceusniger TaxID=68280 RepID=A0A4D4KUI8_STRVO|nr:hypothetical protein SVIO_032380 [Streptomyces violaceusniger]
MARRPERTAATSYSSSPLTAAMTRAAIPAGTRRSDQKRRTRPGGSPAPEPAPAPALAPYADAEVD